MSDPWKNWIPGVLSKEQLKELCKEGYIENVVGWDCKSNKGPIDYSALDLTLTNEGYLMTKGSVKPFGDRYKSQIESQGLIQLLPSDGDGAYILTSTQTYLFKLKERIGFKGDAKLYGQATAKSTIGRMDVLARLIVDGADSYESFDPDTLNRGNGDMYIEITPMTFNVRVKEGIKLSQLRIFRGRPEDSEIRGQEVYEPLLHGESGQKLDGSLSVDLAATHIGGHDVSAFWAIRMKEKDDPLDLWEHEEGQKPDPCPYWRFLSCDTHDRIKIEKNHFYIIRSKEKISLPEGIAVYCKASDETIGEMRIHYAGFVHPFFGTDREDKALGTPLIFEVRGHDVDVSLKDGEKMAQLIFYRMSKPAEKTKKESSSEKGAPSQKGKLYNEQTLKLSNIFADWPKEIKVVDGGTVEDMTK